MNKMKAVIFDLDGVICNTDHYHYLAWKALADKLSIPFDEAVNAKLRGISRMESLEIVLGSRASSYSAAGKAMLAEEKNRLYQIQIQQMTEADLSEEVQSTLKELRARGYLLAIGSSSKNALLILEKLGLSDFFDAVADGTQITHSKPNPEVFLLAAAKLGIKPKEALVIEDATSGIQAAYSGGFRAIGLCSEKNQPDSDITIRRLTSLLDIL